MFGVFLSKEVFMFKINDYVVYGLTGVCQITDIIEVENGFNGETQYYVLNPVYAENMTIKVPVNSQNIQMRPIIAKDDIKSLIAAMPDHETIWVDDARQRTADFKAALRSGKNEEWVRIIKTLYREKEARSETGKKLNKTDEDIMIAAEKNLHEELALALNISPEEVISYILEHVPDDNENIN
jgi:CarD family transcriptional regulator